jgi:hypothetical protein
METVPGSGESISVGVIVRTASGQAQVRQLLSPSVIAGLFGEASKGISSMITTTVVQLQNQLNSGLRVEELQLPFGGFSLADSRECVAKDLNEVFDLAFRFASAFGQSNYGVRQEIKTASKKAFDEWAQGFPANHQNTDSRRVQCPYEVDLQSCKDWISSKSLRCQLWRNATRINIRGHSLIESESL